MMIEIPTPTMQKTNEYRKDLMLGTSTCFR
ncbi:Uncharacterised protein [Burkholderia pseudomallei]|nr:Uncharacterised protein [Burkholderia pseudomallei]VBM94893.1 Uncharacterised protein [Burkholderia pseudomallei]VBX79519.1 Uncharacterised protein [Burkholderia pseudomallei]VBX79551.1 Uncharacterised protein [Burkholderia pseudomallei]VBX88918.1 Uncharacterised protein [Burkholderia pseudomallei]